MGETVAGEGEGEAESMGEGEAEPQGEPAGPVVAIKLHVLRGQDIEAAGELLVECSVGKTVEMTPPATSTGAGTDTAGSGGGKPTWNEQVTLELDQPSAALVQQSGKIGVKVEVKDEQGGVVATLNLTVGPGELAAPALYDLEGSLEGSSGVSSGAGGRIKLSWEKLYVMPEERIR